MSNKYAILVGINRYPEEYPSLKGCLNDVDDIKSYLKRQDFQEQNIMTLTDEEASTTEIKKQLKSLVGKAVSGDTILFHYSGHGSRVGGEDVICPCDFSFTSKDHYISASDFKKIFGSLESGVNFTWISDSCHSGDLRAIRALDLDVEPRCIPKPNDDRGINATKLFDVFTLQDAQRDMKSVALLAACRSDQTAADASFKGRANGAFTFSLLEVLNTSNPDNIGAAFKKTAAAVKEKGFSQVPQMRPEGLNQPLLGITTRVMPTNEPGKKPDKKSRDIPKPLEEARTWLATINREISKVVDLPNETAQRARLAELSQDLTKVGRLVHENAAEPDSRGIFGAVLGAAKLVAQIGIPLVQGLLSGQRELDQAPIEGQDRDLASILATGAQTLAHLALPFLQSLTREATESEDVRDLGSTVLQLLHLGAEAVATVTKGSNTRNLADGRDIMDVLANIAKIGATVVTTVTQQLAGSRGAEAGNESTRDWVSSLLKIVNVGAGVVADLTKPSSTRDASDKESLLCGLLPVLNTVMATLAPLPAGSRDVSPSGAPVTEVRKLVNAIHNLMEANDIQVMGRGTADRGFMDALSQIGNVVFSLLTAVL